LRAAPSDANYVVVDAPGLRERLAPLGILVRDCASFGMPGRARVAVPDDVGIDRLDTALGRIASAP
jgi:histidinol-phosphate/aromatic aminotransferase/cobyric acid decarboxylase-like protein